MFRNFIGVCDCYLKGDNNGGNFHTDFLKPITSFYLSKVNTMEQLSSVKNETICEVSQLYTIVM